MPFTIECKGCGCTFTHTHRRKYCSTDCYWSWFRRQREPTPNGDGTVSMPIGRGYITVIDEGDLDLVSGRTWGCSSSPRHDKVYAICNTDRLLMHRLILGVGPEEQCDHIDGDGLNNRRSNLRVARVNGFSERGYDLHTCNGETE